MGDKVTLENSVTLESVVDCYKDQQICDKAVDNYPHSLKFAPDWYMTQKMCDKAVNIDHSTMQFVSDCYQTQEMCDEAVNRCFLSFIYIPD